MWGIGSEWAPSTRDFAGAWVDLQRLAGDHGADVEGSRDRGDDADHRERRAAEGAGEVDRAGHVGELGADSRPGLDAADLRVGRAGGAGELGLAGLGLGQGDLGVGAFGDSGQLRRPRRAAGWRRSGSGPGRRRGG